MSERTVTLDFVAITVVGLMLGLLLCLSIILSVVQLNDRQKEHDAIHRHLDAICRAIPNCEDAP